MIESLQFYFYIYEKNPYIYNESKYNALTNDEYL